MNTELKIAISIIKRLEHYYLANYVDKSSNQQLGDMSMTYAVEAFETIVSTIDDRLSYKIYELLAVADDDKFDDILEEHYIDLLVDDFEAE